MPFRLPSTLLSPPRPSFASAVGRCLILRAVVAGLAIGAAARAEPAPAEHRPQPSVGVAPRAKPVPAPKLRISKKPYLVAIGPTEIYVRPPAGPRIRRPPLLPPPKVVETEPEPEPKMEPAPEPAQPTPSEPSAFSPDAPPILLPTEQPPTAPAPPARPAPPRESVLAPSIDGDPELKDAVIYFDTPLGTNGARASIPALMPLTSPVSAPQPESRATIRKEKE